MGTINLFGASGHAKVIIDIIEAQGHEVGVLYDDEPNCSNIHGHNVYKANIAIPKGPLIISIGSCSARKLISRRYDVEYATAVHPKTIISNSVVISEGTVVMPGAIINSDVNIGRHCIINTKSSIDHECRIGDFVHIAPGATLSGNVKVGECTWVGAGSVVKQGVKIGKNCMIGAGSVVVKDIPDNVIAYGNPCQVIKENT